MYGRQRSTKTQIDRRHSCWRLFWAAVLLLHGPITINVFASVWQGGESVRWSSILLLTASNLFFLAEIIFAYSLRLLSDRRKVATFLVVIALLHVGVIERGMPEFVQGADIHYWLLLTVTTAVAAHWLMLVIQSSCQRIAARQLVDVGRHRRRRFYAQRTKTELARYSFLHWLAPAPPRAPPLSLL